MAAMSRPYETSLANQIARLNQLIAESEALVSHSSHDETICNVNKELRRQRELRARYEDALRWTIILNRVVLRAHTAFWVCFTMLFVIAFGPFRGKLAVVLGMLGFPLLIASAAGYVGAIIVRDIIARGHRLWRFSLRSIFVTMTVIAVLLSILFLALRD